MGRVVDLLLVQAGLRVRPHFGNNHRSQLELHEGRGVTGTRLCEGFLHPYLDISVNISGSAY